MGELVLGSSRHLQAGSTRQALPLAALLCTSLCWCNQLVDLGVAVFFFFCQTGASRCTALGFWMATFESVCRNVRAGRWQNLRSGSSLLAGSLAAQQKMEQQFPPPQSRINALLGCTPTHALLETSAEQRRQWRLMTALHVRCKHRLP
jgi:hypothetical protein